MKWRNILIISGGCVLLSVTARWWVRLLFGDAVANGPIVRDLYYFVGLVNLLMGLLLPLFKMRAAAARKDDASKSDSESTRSQEMPDISPDIPGLKRLARMLVSGLQGHSSLTTLVKDCNSVLEDLESKRVRIYVVGHQKAGKSTLVNHLAGCDRSPSRVGKCTACLVHIKHASHEKGKHESDDEVRVWWSNDKVPLILNYETFSERMRAWAEADERPYKAEVRTRYSILGSTENELIDTPGSGSHDEEKGELSEERLIEEAIERAAAAILVFKQDWEGTAAHRGLLEELAMHAVGTFAICNIDAHYVELFQSNPTELEAQLEKAQREIKNALDAAARRSARGGLAEIKFYRIKLGGKGFSPNLRAEVNGSSSLDDFVKEITTYLSSRTSFVTKQAINTLQFLTQDAIRKVSVLLNRLEPGCMLLEQKLSIQNAAITKMNDALSTWRPKMGPGGGAAAGAAAGFAAGLAVDLAAAGTTLGAGALSGAVVGFFTGLFGGTATSIGASNAVDEAWAQLLKASVDSRICQKEDREKLARPWQAVEKKEQMDRLLRDLESHSTIALQSDPQYREYSGCKVLKDSLTSIDAIIRVVRRKLVGEE